MSVILQNIFSTDDKSTLINKIEWNFDQLVALGLGTIGSPGRAGGLGLTGPTGRPGSIGPKGNLIFTQNTVPIPEPIQYANKIGQMQAGDILVTSDSILQLTQTNPQTWASVINFSELGAGLGYNIFRLLSNDSRVIKPGLTNGIDLTNSANQTNPNHRSSGNGRTYQTVLYNFNETKTNSIMNGPNGISIVQNGPSSLKIFDASSAVSLTNSTITITGHGYTTGDMITYSSNADIVIGGLTNNAQYYVSVIDANTISLYTTNLESPIQLTSLGTADQVLTGIIPNSEAVFPATSNLSVYSFFNQTATPAAEFQSTSGQKGYRNQIELGSVDNIPSLYQSVISDEVTNFGPNPGEYLISPSFENLKIRKFRINPSSWSTNPISTGTYYIRSEYDLSSSGSNVVDTFSKRSHSEQVWKINKSNSNPDYTRVFEMKLTNRELIALANSTDFPNGIGTIDGINLTRGKTDLIGKDVSNFGIGFYLDKNPSRSGYSVVGLKTSFDITAIDFNSVGIILSGASSQVGINLDAANNNDLVIENLDQTKQISLNSAIGIIGDRLSLPLPFPTSISPLTNPVPVLSSSDPNTLDEYLELNFTPNIGWGTLHTSSDYIVPTVSGASGKMVKIGNQVTLTITFIIRTSLTSTTGAYHYPFYSDSLSPDLSNTVINLGDGDLNKHILGNETNQIMITGIPDHWPDILAGGDRMKFDVDLKNLTSPLCQVTRNWPLTYSVPAASGENIAPDPWLPPAPESIYARLDVFGSSLTDQPALKVYCFKRGSYFPSNFSIVDLFNPDPQIDAGLAGSAIQFTISGTYLTNNSTAEQNRPFSQTTTTTTLVPLTSYTWTVSDTGNSSANLACGIADSTTTTTI